MVLCFLYVTDYTCFEEDRTRLIPAADQAVWRCRAPGNPPNQPDVKTILLIREFPHLLPPSQSVGFPHLSPLCLSVCLAIFPASSAHSVYGKQGKPEHTLQ